jgi:hypothetical protein
MFLETVPLESLSLEFFRIKDTAVGVGRRLCFGHGLPLLCKPRAVVVFPVHFPIHG